MTARILAFAGSARRDSFNQKLLRVAARGARDEGAEVTLADLRDFEMPLYDGDLEAAEGLPERAVAFKELLLAHQGLLIASPEYNSSITARLKNTIDWSSRSAEAGVDLAGWRDKVVALLSASPGPLGGARSLVHLRSILGNIGCVVLPDQMSLRQAGAAFGDDGDLIDERHRLQAERIGAVLSRFLDRLGSGD